MSLPAPAPGPRAQQRQATRQMLIQAGLRVVAENGFVGATTAAIAEASGRAHGTVFLHFPSRDALVAELVEAVGQAMSTALADIPDDQAGVTEVLDAHLLALQAHEVLYARLLREATQLPPVARARVFALQTGIAWHLRQAHARDEARGLARPLDAHAVGNVWIALSNHYLINRDLFASGGSVIAARGPELKAQMLAFIRR